MLKKFSYINQVKKNVSVPSEVKKNVSYINQRFKLTGSLQRRRGKAAPAL
jgi:hypothetical protein